MAVKIFLNSITLPLCTGIGISFLIERLLQSGTRLYWKRPFAALALHVGLWLLVFTFELTVFQRPWFAAAIVSAFLLFIILVSNAKFHSLREPFIFQDFEYFIDALKHPRLYMPFLGMGRALAATAGFGVALFAGLSLEPALTNRIPLGSFLLGLLFLFSLSLLLLWQGSKKNLSVTFDPTSDIQQLGILASLWRYGEEERRHHYVPPSEYNHVGPCQGASETFPHLVVVQSESFFDVRNLFPGIRTEVLQAFDTLKDSAVYSGTVQVPAWGANTVRTEFAFLSGLGADKLGVHRFNPYRKLARQGIPTLTGLLKRLGYRTVCVHPFPASFYARDKIFPLLGFDEFIDINNFSNTEKTGPYIGDQAVAKKVCTILKDATTQPLFIFAITMENHGPLHLEKVWKGDMEDLYSSPPPAGCEDLTVYLRHLRNADHMAGILRTQIESLPGPGWLCWFGDHLPIMPKVYEILGAPDGKTDYLIWKNNGGQNKRAQLDLKIEDLGLLLLKQMGVINILVQDDPKGSPFQSSSSTDLKSVQAVPRQ